MSYRLLISLLCAFIGPTCVHAQELSDKEWADLQDLSIPYNGGMFAGITSLKQCGSFRVYSLYWNGQDMLYLDEPEPIERGSAMGIKRQMSFWIIDKFHGDMSIREFSCRQTQPGFLLISGSGKEADKRFTFHIEVDTKLWRYRYNDSLGRPYGERSRRWMPAKQ